MGYFSILKIENIVRYKDKIIKAKMEFTKTCHYGGYDVMMSLDIKLNGVPFSSHFLYDVDEYGHREYYPGTECAYEEFKKYKTYEEFLKSDMLGKKENSNRILLRLGRSDIYLNLNEKMFQELRSIYLSVKDAD